MTQEGGDRSFIDEEALLAELVREAERALDLQVRAFERADGRGEQLIALGVGALLAGLSAVSSAAARAPLPRGAPFVVLAFAGSMATLLSIGWFVRAYLGLRDHPGFRTGPSSEWLLAESRSPAPSLGLHHRKALQVHADDYTENIATLYRTADARGFGVRSLVLGVLLFVGALLYIGGW